MTNPLLVIPGFMGSQLTRTSDRERIWVDPRWAVANVNEFLENLALLTPTDDRLRPDGILQDVNVADLVRVGIYRELHEFCITTIGIAPQDYYEFAYDWRKTLNEAARPLDATLTGIPNPPVTVIAHSQGGLILSALFRDYPRAAERIGKIIAVGCPFAGLLKTIAMIEQGSGILTLFFPHDPIRGLLTGMPGTYELFPSRATTGLFRDPAGRPATPCHDPSWFPATRYSQTLLRAACDQIGTLPLQFPVPLRFIEGYGVQTATSGQATTSGPTVEWSIQGDGTCPARSLLAATGTSATGEPATRLTSIPFGEHVELIHDRQFLTYLKEELTGEPHPPQIVARVRETQLPTGTDNLLIVETRNPDGNALDTGTPSARTRHGLNILPTPCPIAKTARWLARFPQPNGPDQLIVKVPGVDPSLQPPPLLLNGT